MSEETCENCYRHFVEFERGWHTCRPVSVVVSTLVITTPAASVEVLVTVRVLLLQSFCPSSFSSQSASTKAARPRTRMSLICILRVERRFWVVGSDLEVVERVCGELIEAGR